MGETFVGAVSHYFGKPGVAALTIAESRLDVGDTIHIVGHTTDFTQQIGSMQIDHADVESVGPGDEVGIKVDERVRIHDKVYRVDPD